MVTATDVQTLLVLEVGDTPDALLSRNIATIWASYADKAAVWPRLQELYAKRRCIDIVLGALRGDVDQSTDGTSERAEQRLLTLEAMRTEAEAEIGVLEARATAVRIPALGTVTLTTPVPVPGPLPTFGPPDGNSMAYSGSPYTRLPWRY